MIIIDLLTVCMLILNPVNFYLYLPTIKLISDILKYNFISIKWRMKR